MVEVTPWLSMASPKYQLYEFCESKSPGSTYFPSARMIVALAG